MNIFITGVSSGLGKALAAEFLHDNHNVWAVARRKLDDWDTNKDLQSKKKFRYMICDVSIYSDVERVCKVMLEEQFIPDIIILNAGIMENDLNGAFSHETFKKVYQINLLGAVSWINIFLPIFLERNRGIFVAISSLSSYRGLNSKMIAYGGSKAALNMTFECFRLQLLSTGVRFITVNPGRMVGDKDGNGLMRITYTSAAKKIAGHVLSKRSANILTFPFISSVVSKILRVMPDFIVAKMIKY